MSRKILVTSALPYANGQIHIGHLVEYLQTDIWVRFQKLTGQNCRYFCADDTHGSAIMIRAQKEGRSEEALIAAMRESHLRDFTDFQIHFDNYGSTNSPESRFFCEDIWKGLRQSGIIKEKMVSQFFDPVKKMFLSDRDIKGTCPKCGALDQHGDNCEKCGAVYRATEVINPYSVHSGVAPEMGEAPHLFVDLEMMHDFLDEWTQTGGHLRKDVANYLAGFFLNDKLHDWDISRPAPYFGFEIPDFPQNYWYVWYDAPIGYLGSTLQWCNANGEKVDDWWKSESTEIHHFIGKDITYFHTLFWPVMLKLGGYSLPTQVHIHGFLTVNGEKMSKSKGTFISARSYLNHLDPAYLRYYYATKIGGGTDDLDLNLDEFITKVNSDMVGKIVNLASRTAKFVETTGLSEQYPDDGGLFAQAAADASAIAAEYEAGDFSKALRIILAAGDRANKFVEDAAPWTLKKDPDKKRLLQDICSIGLNLFRQIVVYLSPILPSLAQMTGELLNDPITCWDQAQTPLTGTKVNKYQYMMTRVDPKKVEAMIEESKIVDKPAEAAKNDSGKSGSCKQSGENAPSANNQAAPAVSATTAAPIPEAAPSNPWDAFVSAAADVPSPYNDSDESLKAEPLEGECTIDDFCKVDMRVARILTAEEVPDARKLLKLTLNLGGNNNRQVFAGIKSAYKNPSELVGRLVVCVANLKPRKMKFGMSEAMVGAAGPGGAEIFLLSPDEGAKPGQRIH